MESIFDILIILSNEATIQMMTNWKTLYFVKYETKSENKKVYKNHILYVMILKNMLLTSFSIVPYFKICFLSNLDVIKKLMS